LNPNTRPYADSVYPSTQHASHLGQTGQSRTPRRSRAIDRASRQLPPKGQHGVCLGLRPRLLCPTISSAGIDEDISIGNKLITSPGDAVARNHNLNNECQSICFLQSCVLYTRVLASLCVETCMCFVSLSRLSFGVLWMRT
jgi:hypothetical protein